MENKMIKTAILTLMFVIGIVGIGRNVRAATRIFYEDCEDTTFTEHFLERYYGTTEYSYWVEFKSEVTRSTDSPHSGSYCMTYDPWTTGNPHANVGYDVGNGYGNKAKFYLKDYNINIWYFRWYHKWETGISYSGSAKNKNIYIGYHEWGGDFVLNLEKSGSGNWHLVIFKNPGYEITVNKYLSMGYSVDDNQWHKMEVYIDLGTTGPTGICTITVDDTIIYSNTAVYYRDAIGINGNIINKMSWPANTSGYPVGTNRQWLDDLEIWDGIPEGINENNIAVYPNPCKVYMGHNSITFNNLSSNDIIRIYNISGKLVHNSGNIANKNYRWSVGNVSSGVYFYKVKGNNKTSGKIVIIR
ncbi:hypothetical protein DRP43_03975 [candidate division TA06 bacterium]|uniref:Secretion system C-terminal sorting domain-containing protein n=1 Tax=candidate division TA06 bacterium TaxID=2250710 RepID=A0A660SGN8_UNCT6|nr:MAG: hypothetical protein DRP43_03975 [candidate division TA06 bacterium]